VKAILTNKQNIYPRDRQIGLLDRMAKHAVINRLRGVCYGSLVIYDHEESYEFGTLENDEPRATIFVKNPSFYKQVAFGGTIGAGEAYMAGHFECSDLTAAVQLLLRNRHVLDGMDSSATRITAPFAFSQGVSLVTS
jgi:cyclopropane-fatty-acyl-phospholipid synthase